MAAVRRGDRVARLEDVADSDADRFLPLAEVRRPLDLVAEKEEVDGVLEAADAKHRRIEPLELPLLHRATLSVRGRSVQNVGVWRPMERGNSIQVLGKAALLLDRLAEEDEVGAARLAELIGEPRSTVYRLLANLQQLELVEPGAGGAPTGWA